jgi:hypothetical protein
MIILYSILESIDRDCKANLRGENLSQGFLQACGSIVTGQVISKIGLDLIVWIPD